VSDFPDFYSPFVIKGWDGTEYQTVKVTNTGEMYILVSALYNSTITGLKCDSLGNLLLNIKAQDLAEVINRPKYGACTPAVGAVACPADVTTGIVDVEGKGVIYGGFLNLQAAAAITATTIKITIDDTVVEETQPYLLWDYQLLSPWSRLFYLLRYTDAKTNITLGLSPGITFESSFTIDLVEGDSQQVDVENGVFYALV